MQQNININVFAGFKVPELMDHQEGRLETLKSGANICSTNYDTAEEKSWYILTLLARIGRPCTPQEISERCRFFSVAPDEVLHLCRIPGSPLAVIEGCITGSKLSISVFEKLYSTSVSDPRSICTEERKSELPLKCSRKRLLEELEETNTSRQPNKVRKQEVLASRGNCRQPQIPSPLGRDPSNQPTNSVGFGACDGAPEGEMPRADGNPTIHNIIGGSDCKKSSSPLEAIIAAGVAETGAVNTDMAVTTVQTENCQCVMKSMQSSGSPGGNCKFKNDCFRTYKRRKGEISKIQIGSMDKENIFHFNTCKKEVGTCSFPSQQMQTGIMHDDIQAFKLEGEGVKHDHATLVGDAVVSMQACIASTEVNLIPQKEVPTKNKMTNCPIGHIVPEDSAIGSIIKSGDAKCEQKDAQILKSKLNSEMPSKKVDDLQVSNLPKREEACDTNEKTSNAKRKSKKTGKAHTVVKDEMDTTVPTSKMNDVGLKRIPLFESFIVEEEEGSGGYGTVYKARRKQDGKIFAIKCPLEKTTTNHVKNEIKMLERFGGKNFIIKYEGAFKDNECYCLILQHVEHEKPEVLKREIDLSQLRWYGFCMFKALQTLHKQGIIHRDVKPGNFLFSRKSNKGYLIDFNLAVDEFDLNAGRSKPKMPLHNLKSVVGTAAHKPPFIGRRDIHDFRQKALIAAAEATNVAQQTRPAYVMPSGNALTLKRRGQTVDMRHRDSSNHRPQSNLPPDTMDTNNTIKLGERTAAKISGLHLLVSPSKEITSARTPSGGNRREPLPNQGRKELLNLLHEAQQSPQQQAPVVPVSQRKRVAAPQDRVRRDNNNFIHVSPMPFRPGINTGTYGLNNVSKNKDSQKLKREGPCVGTRGYRAPEVLLRSLHQGFKLDIWSAGVTLLYLIVGKIPFQGNSSDQAIKDIAKFRGMEEIWELAKLHDRESSLPQDLVSADSTNISIEEWCRNNTKRPEFLDSIPRSLYDLINMCLCVNPRQRIDADQALQHGFFAPCYEVLKKARSSSRQSVLTDLTSAQTSSSAC